MRALVLAILSLVIASAAQAPQPSNGTAGAKTVVTDINLGPTSTAAVPPLTDHEIALYRSAQIRLVKAQIAIAPDPLWKELQAAQAELNALPATFISTRKLDPATHGLCDGPTGGNPTCAGLTEGELALRTLSSASSAKPTTAPEVKK